MKKNFIISILITTVAIIAIFFVYTTNKKPSEIPPAKEVPVEDMEGIVGWQTYRNEELGFEVQYPEGWFVKDYQENNPKNPPLIGFDPWESNPGGSVWSVVRYDRMIDKNEDQMENLIAQQVRNYDESSIERNDVTLNTYPATEVITESDRKIIGVSVYITYKQYIYVIHAENYSNVDPEKMSWPYNEKYTILKQLGEDYSNIFLKSFRFID